ncbi:hypothetical protein BDV59DRAFT_43349 [Aspergillus ambiguus]|uniref:uncharacterized protein n=1 Tax=Aspergillus ambiguus TaxID=176160 RepID=UPI003CCE3028
MPPRGFFDAFPDFEVDPNIPISEEFKRLARKRQWKQGSKIWRKMWNRFINLEYDRYFGGSTPAGLEGWRQLCDELDLEGPFSSITHCKKALCRVHVNIVDLVEGRQTGQKPRTFPTVGALARYTHETQRFFNRNSAKQDKILRVLLRKLL